LQGGLKHFSGDHRRGLVAAAGRAWLTRAYDCNKAALAAAKARGQVLGDARADYKAQAVERATKLATVLRELERRGLSARHMAAEVEPP
jgi:hypothetical protein